MRRASLALVLLVAAGACATDDPTGPSPRLSAEGALAAKAPVTRPFHADVSGTVTVGDGPACQTGAPASATGGGTATHLGRFTIVSQTACLTEDGSGTEGEFTWRAANGDLLTGTYEFTTEVAPDGSVVVTSLEGEITGGTGRFAGATGPLTLDAGTFVFQDATHFDFDVGVDGTIRY